MTAAPTDPLTEAFRAACAPDRIHDIGEAALLMGALDRREADLGPYRAHLAELAAKARRHREVEEAAVRGQILADIMGRDFGYEGDEDQLDNPENANLLSVIDRRAGLPVTLGILYLHMARAAGWRAAGTTFPGQFLVRVEGEDGITVIDPFDEGREIQQADLYSMMHRVAGRMARIDEEFTDPVPDQSILIRTLNNIKAVAASRGEMGRALEILDRMLIVAPNEAAFLYEQSQLLLNEGHPRAAKAKLEAVIALDPKSPYAERCREDIADIKLKLN